MRMNPASETAPIAHDVAEGRAAVLLVLMRGRSLEVLAKHDLWFTDSELRREAKAEWPGLRMSLSSVGARRRDLRKAKYGGHKIEGRVRKGQPGVWEYRLVNG